MFSPEMIAVLVVVNLFAAIVIVLLVRRLLFRKKIKKIAVEWPEVVKLVKDKTMWTQAIIAADDMLEVAVQKHGAKSKSYGENLVSLQAKFTDNESLWFAHKLANKLRSNELEKIKPDQAKRAILAFKKALYDLGELQ
jgi:hypothetical protein